LAVAAYQRETARRTTEFSKILDNWPLRLYPSEIIGSPSENSSVPLRIIIAPPEIDYDRFGIANKDFPKLEKRLAQGIREFVENYYPLNSHDRPIEFLGGAWDSNRFHSEASIKRLFTMLKSEPTLILESEVDGEYINLRLAYWSGGQDIYGYKTVISKLGHLEMVKAFAKARLLEGKPNAELPKGTKIEHNAKDFEKFCDFLVACHELLAGLFVDVHYLIHYNRSLQLPFLLPEIIKIFPDHQISKDIIQWIINGYRDAFEVLKVDRSYWIPDLMLELAQGLAGLEDKSWATELVAESNKEWLRLRGILLINDDIVKLMEPILISGDKDYLCKLENCFSSLGNEQAVIQTKCLIGLVEKKIRLESELENQHGEEGNVHQKVEQDIELMEEVTASFDKHFTKTSAITRQQDLTENSSDLSKTGRFKLTEQSMIGLPRKEKMMTSREKENVSDNKSSLKDGNVGLTGRLIGKPVEFVFDFIDRLASGSLKPIKLFTYSDAIQYFVEERPQDSMVQKGAILRRSHPEGQLIIIIQIFLDGENSLLFNREGRLYGRQLLVKSIDNELHQAFGDCSIILVE
jgi:hypothetical protein